MGRKKTERIYTPVESMSHFAKKIGSFGDKTALRYFDKERNLHTMTYRSLSARILRVAAGYTAAGLAGKRIAIIGETSPDWIASYIAAIAAGGMCRSLYVPTAPISVARLPKITSHTIPPASRLESMQPTNSPMIAAGENIGSMHSASEKRS